MITHWDKFNEKIDLLKLFPDVERIVYKKSSRHTDFVLNPTAQRLKKIEERIERLLSTEEINIFIGKLQNSLMWFHKNDIVSFVANVQGKLRDAMTNKVFEIFKEVEIKGRKFEIGDIVYIEDRFPSNSGDSFTLTLLNKRTRSGKRIDSYCDCDVLEDNIKRSDEAKKLSDIKIRTDRFDI